MRRGRTLAITGAGGFLGRRIVAAAREAGHDVIAIVRQPVDLPGAEVRIADLAADLPPGLMDGADAVIHAAAGAGDDAAHARDTVGATRAVLAALPLGVRLVLVSSFSVYAVAALPDSTTLDETTPTEPEAAGRDAYARAKLAQERLAIVAAQTGGLDVWIARPGAIYGPGRDWSARLGWQVGGRVAVPGGDVPVPAVHVDHAARALVAAATVPEGGWPDDVPILEAGGHVRVVNLVDPDPPTQRDWLAATNRRRVTTLPRRPLMKLAALLDLACDVVPALDRVRPRILSEGALAARFKPLRYATARAEDRLNHRPEASFADGVAADRA